MSVSIYSGLNRIMGNSSGDSLTQEQKEKLSKLIIGGDGSKILADDGNYIELVSSSTTFAEESDVLALFN